MKDDIELGLDDVFFERVKSESEQLCPICQQVLWLSFYFDGFGCSKTTTPATNVLKLHNASYEFEDEGKRKFYYPGLGADFDPETRVLAAAIADKAGDAIYDKTPEMAQDKARERTKAAVEDAWARSQGIRDRSLIRRAMWTAQEVLEQGKEAAGRAGRQAKRLVAKPRKQWARIERNLRREWQDYWEEVTRHPWRAAQSAGQAGAKVSAGAVAESWGWVRDGSLGAALFNTGVEVRLNAARRDFQLAVMSAQQRLPIHKINVAIFGYDMGGGLALAFAQRLLEGLMEGGAYQGIPVHIRFMGLFDCVTNRYDDNLLTGFMPLSNQVSSQLHLSPQVERCVHYAAAHELRFYKPLSMLGADPEDCRGPRQERLFPGAQVDVGGGADEDDENASDNVSRYPLQMMYHRAYAAGIPMPSLEKLADINPDLHQTFLIPPEITTFQRNYRAAVKQLAATTREIPSLVLESGRATERFKPQIVNAQASAYQCTVPAAPLFISLLPTTIEEELSGHTVIFIHWLRMWYDQHQHSAGRKTRGWGLGVPLDPKAFGRYQKLADELAYMDRHARSGPQFDPPQARRQLDGEVAPDIFISDPQAQALFWLWNNPGSRIAEIEALYPHFLNDIHDSMAESDIETAFGAWVHARHYMNRRAIHRLSTAPDPGFLQRLELAYERFFAH